MHIGETDKVIASVLKGNYLNFKQIEPDTSIYNVLQHGLEDFADDPTINIILSSQLPNLQKDGLLVMIIADLRIQSMRTIHLDLLKLPLVTSLIQGSPLNKEDYISLDNAFFTIMCQLMVAEFELSSLLPWLKSAKKKKARTLISKAMESIFLAFNEADTYGYRGSAEQAKNRSVIREILNKIDLDPLLDDKYYTTLSISRTATPKEVTKRYRELAIKYHPDKLVSQNASPELVEQATLKFIAVKEAYKALTAVSN